MFQDHNRETRNSTWKVAVSFKIIMTTMVHDKTVFHNIAPDLQDQDQDQDRFFGLRPVLSQVRPTVSDHITVISGLKV